MTSCKYFSTVPPWAKLAGRFSIVEWNALLTEKKRDGI